MLLYYYVSTKKNSFNAQFTAQILKGNPDDYIALISVVSIGNWITAGCLTNMSSERDNILLVTKPLGDKCEWS